MASLNQRSQVTRFFLVFVLFVGFAASCTSQSSSRHSCSSEEWYNASYEIVPRRPSRQSTRQCLLSLLSDAIASRAEMKTKRTEYWPPFQLRAENTEEIPGVDELDKTLPRVPLDAIRGILGKTFSSTLVETDCPENLRRRHKPAVLRSDINSDWFVSKNSPCAARVDLDIDPNRWPQSLLRVECACEEERCSIRGPHSCITLSTVVDMKRRRYPGEDWQTVSEPVAIGCICASRRARVMQQSRPNLVRR